MKKSTAQYRKGLNSYIREIEVKFKPLDSERIRLQNPELVVKFIQEKIGNEARENFVLLCVDSKNNVVSYSLISIGTISEAVVHPREVFLPAILSKAQGFIVAHNHPSGSITPSAEDINATTRLKDAAKLLGIPMLDHIIVGCGGVHYSMQENGFLS